MTRIGSLCSGYEGLGAAVQEVLGGELAWVADNDPGASAILAHRFPGVPNLGDIAATRWGDVEPVRVLAAGFPCQDVSCAGARRGLRKGNRTGVWTYVAEAIAALQPPLVLLENVRGLLTFGADSDLEPCSWCMGDSGDESVLRACGAVLADLADLGFDAEWQLVSAAEVGAPHRRERVFILAWPAADAADIQRGMGSRGRLAGTGRAAAAAEAGDDRVGVAADAGGERRDGRPRVGGDGWPASIREQARSDSGDGGIAPAADPDGATGRERRLAAPGEAEGGRSRADSGRRDRALAADAEHDGLAGAASARAGTGEEPGQRGQRRIITEPPGDRGERASTADADLEHLGQDWRAAHGDAAFDRPEHAEPTRGRGATPADPERHGRMGGGSGHLPGVGGNATPAQHPGWLAPEHDGLTVERPAIAWGAYELAIRRWEHATGRPAPRPTEPGRTGERLSPRFVEWMMGLPEGWVTDVPGLSRNAQLKALGNGVVPQQAAMALRLLLDRADIPAPVAAEEVA